MAGPLQMILDEYGIKRGEIKSEGQVPGMEACKI